MQRSQHYYPDCPEAFLVSLARTGDRKAFEALVLLPANTVATLLVITYKALRFFHKTVAGSLPGRP